MCAQAADLLIKGGTVLDPGHDPADQDVLIVDGRIEALGQFSSVLGVEELDATKSFVLPGFVNAHTHSGENYNPGRYENLPLDMWYVRSHDVAREAPLSADVIYARTLLGALQMMRTGTTTVVDFLYEAPSITLDGTEAVVRAYLDAGMRATVVLGLSDKPFVASLPAKDTDTVLDFETPAPNTEQLLELVEACVSRWNNQGGLIKIGVGPSAPQRCSARLLEASAALARSQDLVWHTHVQETKSQALMARTLHGTTFIDVLDKMGLLWPGASIAHAVWITDRDIEVLAQRGVTVMHCLLSNLRLGDGVARLPDLVTAGVRVALGTDGRGCDESLDMLELVKVVTVLHKNHGYPRERWPTAGEIMAMASRGGSRAAGYIDSLGVVTPGAYGDFVLIDKDDIALTPLNDPIRQVVYGRPLIHSVIIGGKVVMRDRKFVRINEEALLIRAREYGEAVVTDAGKTAASEDAIEFVARESWEEAERRDIGMSAYLGGRPTWA